MHAAHLELPHWETPNCTCLNISHRWVMILWKLETAKKQNPWGLGTVLHACTKWLTVGIRLIKQLFFLFFSHMSHSREGLPCCHFKVYITYISKSMTHKKWVTQNFFKPRRVKFISLFKLYWFRCSLESPVSVWGLTPHSLHGDTLDWCNFYDIQVISFNPHLLKRGFFHIPRCIFYFHYNYELLLLSQSTGAIFPSELKTHQQCLSLTGWVAA